MKSGGQGGEDRPLPPFEQLGLALRVLRERKGLSQAEAARAAGIGKGQLSKYEQGKELPKLSSLARLLDGLQSTPLTLFYTMHFLASPAELPAVAALSLLQEGTAAPLLSREEAEGFETLVAAILLLFQKTLFARTAGVGAPPRSVETPSRGDRT